MNKRFKLYKGFTLIEVMVAMAVFAIAGVALIASTSTHFTNLSVLETKMLANWVASNQLVEASLEQSWPLKNNKEGKVELAGREWFWKQRIAKTNDKDMSQVAIEIRLKETDKLSLSSLSTYVIKEGK
jgi:general secretion pathway protein I